MKSDANDMECTETIVIEVVEKTPKRVKKILYKDSSDRFMCERCAISFHTPHMLTKHCLKEHNQRPLYKCNSCDMKFKLLAHLRSHSNVHQRSRTFPCDKCDKEFCNESSLRRHIRNRVCQDREMYEAISQSPDLEDSDSFDM